MLKPAFMLGCLVILLSGCASTQPIPVESLQSATRIVEKQTYVQAPVNRSAFRLAYGNDPALEKAFNQYIKSGKAPNIVTSGFVQFAYNNGQQPVIKTSPGQETVISLEPGERFTNVTTGNPGKWTYSAAMSGTGSNQQTHILVVPLYPGISTNMVITTDRRLYNIKMVSSEDGDYVRNVRFWYPEDMANNWNNKAQQEQNNSVVTSVPDVNLSNLNFNYNITSGWSTSPSWKPIRVFDDGKQTFIEFPASMSNREMPVLFTVDGANKRAMVNYRSKPPYFGGGR